MEFKKRFIVAIAIPVIGLATLGASQVFAQSNGSQISGLAQAIAQKFNLDPNQVQTEISTYRQNTRQNRLQNRLDKLVSQGKISSAQKQAILDELNTLSIKYNLSSPNTMSKQDRQTALKNLKTDFQSWAKSQNINLPFFGFGPKGFNRFGK